MGGDTMKCMLCDEVVVVNDLIDTEGILQNVVRANPSQWMHRECGLRSALGGIGHVLAHEYWCLQRNDPDAGLTFRQSAIMVDHLVNILGVDVVVALERTP